MKNRTSEKSIWPRPPKGPEPEPWEYRNGFSVQTGNVGYDPSAIPAELVARCHSAKRRNKGELMTRILLLGLYPETVDFSDPALPPGMNVEKVHAGIAVAL